MTLEHLARTIAKARHGTDCEVCGGGRLHYANCPLARPDEEVYTLNSFRVALIAQPDGGQEGDE